MSSSSHPVLSTSHLPISAQTREVEYAGYVLGPSHASVQTHPQFAHLKNPPENYLFTSRPGSSEYASAVVEFIRTFNPKDAPPHTTFPSINRVVEAIVSIARAALGYGATVDAVRKFFIDRNVEDCLRIPESALLAFVPTFPFSLGGTPWLVEIEDTTTLFYPDLRNGSTAEVDPRSLPCFPVLKALLESSSCRGILTHVSSTAQSVRLLFKSDIIAAKVYYVPMGVDLPERANAHDRTGRQTINLLFTNSWHQEPTSFFLRGGHDVLEAFSQLAEKYPQLVLTIRSGLPTLSQKHQELVKTHPRIRLISDFLGDDALDRMMRETDIYLLPAAHIHVVSMLKAMAYGIPVIASDGWGFGEYIEDGQNGFLVKGRKNRVSWEDAEHKLLREDYRSILQPDGVTPEVVDGLIATISKLVDPDYRQKISRQARASVETRFTTAHWNRGLNKMFDAIYPLRESAAVETVANEPAVGPIETLGSAGAKPRILLIPLEFMSWQRAKSWSYSGGLGIEEGLIANGADCFVLPAWFEFPAASPDSLLKYARELCQGRVFDQVWIWLTHNQYGDEFLNWVASLAPIRVGLTMESMEHTAEELRQFPQFVGRWEFVAAQLRYMTHVVVADEVDAESFSQRLSLPARWFPVMIPRRCVCDRIIPSPASFATFSGALYGSERAALLGYPPLQGLLSMPILPEQNTPFPQQFDHLHAALLSELRKTGRCEVGQLVSYVDRLRQLRRRLFDLWLEGVRLGFASVNLPSIFKSYAGRVAESMAAGTPVISWKTFGRPRNLAQYTPGKEILLFDRDQPGQLAAHLRRLKADPDFALQLAENAREKILAEHTAEIGTQRILAWVAAAPVTSVDAADLSPRPPIRREVPADYCLKPGYQSRPVPNYFEDKYTADAGITWQPDVYSFGADIARQLGCTRIIDVGCGRAQKLMQLEGEFETVGIDFGSNLEYCKNHYKKGRWLEADFEKEGALPVTPSDATVVICSDVIEHMIKPEALLAKVRGLLESGSVAVISTPERDLTWGPAHQGPPPNPCHTREWSLAEFKSLLECAGLTVEYAGLTRSHDQDPARKTILAIVGNAERTHLVRFQARRPAGSEQTFAQWLEQLNEPPAEPAPPTSPTRSTTARTQAERLVSVVVPCYNHAQYLKEAVESVVAQTFRNWEIIIVNDGSPDDTNRVARELIAKYPKHSIRLLEKKNGGLADARNAGIREAKGDYILPLDADDRIHPEMLAKTVGLLDQNPEIGIAYTDYVYFGHLNQRLYTTEYNFQTLCTAYNQFTCTSLYRKAAWAAVGGYNTNMVSGYEDWDFWVGCGDHGFYGKRIPEVLFYYRTKKKSMVSDARKNHQALFARIVLNHAHLYVPELVAQATELLTAAGVLTKAENAPSKTTPAQAEESEPAVDRTPLVSICIPTYNGEEFLAQAIASALAQSYSAIEIIISDDASCDRTLEIAGAGLRQSPFPVRLVRHERLGLVGNWNHCVREARGKYIKFLFQDDLLEPDCVSQLVAVAVQDPRIGLVFSPRKILVEESMTKDGKAKASRQEDLQVHRSWAKLVGIQPGTALLADPDLLLDPVNKVGEPSTVLLLKAAVENLGGFDESLQQVVDVDLWFRLMAKYHIGFVDQSLSSFRLHRKQATQVNVRAGLITKDWQTFFTKVATDPAYASLSAAHRTYAAQSAVRMGAEAPKATAPSEYYLKAGYHARAVPDYFEDKHTVDTGITWQPDVYRFAADVARRLGCTRIIDVGCGRAQKLGSLQNEFETIGVDFGKNLEYCRSHYEKGLWLEADFEKDEPLPVAEKQGVGAVVICSDVIEHMIKPEALLAKIKRLLQTAAVAIISTPERDLTWGQTNLGPPPNPCHTREWNLAEFTLLLRSTGLPVEYAGLTRSHDQDPARKTILAVVGNIHGDHRNRFGTPSDATARVSFSAWLQDLNQDPPALNRSTQDSAPSAAGRTEEGLVSIVIPCYDQAQYLEEAVQSVIAQTYPRWEVIIVNDGSTDDTSAVAQNIVLSRPTCRIRLIEKKNGGLSDARNAGIRVAVGQYILPLDADDKIHPEFLAKTVALLERHPKIGIAYTDWLHFGAENSRRNALDYDLGRLCKNENLFTCTSLYRREAWDAAGGYNINMTHGLEDWDFWIGCAEHGFFGQRIPEPLFFYRVKGGSMIARLQPYLETMFARIILNHPKIYTPEVVANALKTFASAAVPGPKESSRGSEWKTPRGNRAANFSDLMAAAEKLIRAGRLGEAATEIEQALDFAPTAQHLASAQAMLEMLRKNEAANLASGASARPANPEEFFGADEVQTIEQLLSAYSKDPNDVAVRDQVEALQQGLMTFLVEAESTALEAQFRGSLGQVFRAVIKSGLPSESPTAEAIARRQVLDEALASAESQPGALDIRPLLARMVCTPAHRASVRIALEKIPGWLLDDYLSYVLSAPPVFVTEREIDEYHGHMLAWARTLFECTRTAPHDPLTLRAASFFALRANYIPLYLSSHNTRELARARAGLIEYTLRRNGAVLDAKLPHRPKGRKKIKVGYLNAHFGGQTETHVTLPTLQLDRDKFEICLFPVASNPGPIEAYCRSFADSFTPLPSDLAEQVKLIRAAALDVVIIGTNVTAVTNQVALLATHRLAPLQLVSYCSPVSTGMRNIDGYLSGTLLDFPGIQEHFTEKLCFCEGPPGCLDYTVEKEGPARAVDRASLGLAADDIVFINAASCFKILPEMQRTWAKILKAVPRSRLVVLPFNPNWSNVFPAKQFERTLRDIFSEEGVGHEALVFGGSLTSRAEVKAIEKTADVYLDTSPFSGSISVIDPLELGLPPVVWEGKTPRSRMAAALLRELGMTELIVENEESYIRLAIELATDPSHRAEVRGKIHAAMATGPTFINPRAYAQGLGSLIESLVHPNRPGVTRPPAATARLIGHT